MLDLTASPSLLPVEKSSFGRLPGIGIDSALTLLWIFTALSSFVFARHCIFAGAWKALMYC